MEQTANLVHKLAGISFDGASAPYSESTVGGHRR